MSSDLYCPRCGSRDSAPELTETGDDVQSPEPCKWCGEGVYSYPRTFSTAEEDEKELKSVREAAKAGDPAAQFRLALLIGDDAVEETGRWLMAAARGDNAPACMWLCDWEIEYGPAYGKGEGDPFQWYRKGRSLGQPHDLSMLGHIGHPIELPFDSARTPEEELAALIRFAKAGDHEAQTGLALCYGEGNLGCPVDMIQAYAWCATAMRHDPDTPRNPPADPHGAAYGVPATVVERLNQVFTDAEYDDAIVATKELALYRERHPPVSRRPPWIIVISAVLLLTVLVALSYKMI